MAEVDLSGLWAHVAANGSETAANRLLGRMATRFQHLIDVPLAGSSREQLGPGLRVTFEGKYAIYYYVIDTELIIVRVLHGTRDIAAIAERGDLSA